ncbi:putative membrane protein [Weissella oryzae SG25]|uniref:Putative membrane protein n=1 Tax=Weissella oryzae (strain DSM 25784 / JCM 18191 / LMG 30913 / SG25) TaxID=1329250 RepID=A0A069CTG0_WEIOS|nr:QueT transporter family protein [Weissella oryzae]GAK31105.1 putative membrane protein [Weissella oryzae SG25]
MEKQNIQHTSKTRQLALIAVVAAFYVVVTTLIKPLSYGAIQFRVSEALNHLVVFNKRYIWALTIGVFIANMSSSLGPIDMVVGTLGTLVMTTMTYFATKHVKSVKVKLLISVLIDTAMMWVVAAELYYVLKAPFWITFGTVAIGEFVALVLGAILLYYVNKYIDLTA